jgi:23S rRNA pseudouridine1911/1915/1917 synthase
VVKVSSSDVIAILRRFELANEQHMPRHIEQLSVMHPNAVNTMASFRFNKQQYYVLFDDTAEDELAYIEEQVRTHKDDAVGEVVENPNDHMTTYALPFKGKEVYVYAVRSTKKRLDTLLAERYPDISRSTWQKHIKAGHVSVNGTERLSPKSDVSEADALQINIPNATDFSDHELPIIYLDDNVIVINKPAGILTHAKGALNDEFTVAEFFRRYTSFGLDTNRPGIVHRLDRDTSGVMIGARTPEAAHLLQKQFADRKTKKTYIAVLNGHVKQDEAKIDLPIGRHPNAPSTFRVDAKGKDAITRYKVLAATDMLTLVELRPETGRTHQLRVHMQYLGAPILGDRVYGKPADRLYLHAAKLEITIPISERKVFEAPVPPELTEFFDDLSL